MEHFEATINFDKQQIISIFRQLQPDERQSIFGEFKEDIYSWFFKTDIQPLSIEEYNKKLLESENDFREKKYISGNEMLNKINKWAEEK